MKNKKTHRIQVLKERQEVREKAFKRASFFKKIWMLITLKNRQELTKKQTRYIKKAIA